MLWRESVKAGALLSWAGPCAASVGFPSHTLRHTHLGPPQQEGPGKKEGAGEAWL